MRFAVSTISKSLLSSIGSESGSFSEPTLLKTYLTIVASYLACILLKALNIQYFLQGMSDCV